MVEAVTEQNKMFQYGSSASVVAGALEPGARGDGVIVITVFLISFY
jgi:hypothetical protein